MILLYTPHDISVFSLYHAQTFFTMLTKVMIECQWIMYARLTLFIITKITVYQTYDFLFICNIASIKACVSSVNVHVSVPNV